MLVRVVSFISSGRVLLFCTHLPLSAFYTLSLHDALPILITGARGGRPASTSSYMAATWARVVWSTTRAHVAAMYRSEEHTSELQSHSELVCRLLLEKKNRLF